MDGAAEHRWPCARCGAPLRFEPGATELRCPFCGHVQAIAPSAGRTARRALGELPLDAGLRDDLPEGMVEPVRSTRCPSCGATVEAKGAEFALPCPFCASPVVIDAGDVRRIRPQALIPFALTEDQARDALTRWLGGLWFAPNALLQYTRAGRAMAGLYVPFWTFDADTRTTYSGQRGDHWYETRMVTVNVGGRMQQQARQVRHTRWTPARGQVARGFDDVLVTASAGLPQGLGDALTPWDLGALVPYSPDYLAGFRAEGYTISLRDGHAAARERMAQIIAGDVRRAIGGDEQRMIRSDTDWSGETFKHILLPVWMAAYRYGGKSYRFLVNGQTGEVQGERPYSAWKIAFAGLAAALLALALVYLRDPAALGLPVPGWMTWVEPGAPSGWRAPAPPGDGPGWLRE